jgi:hypothetical protein
MNMTTSSTQILLQLVMTTSLTQATDSLGPPSEPFGPPSEPPGTLALASIFACFFSTQALIGGSRLSRFVNII